MVSKLFTPPLRRITRLILVCLKDGTFHRKFTAAKKMKTNREANCEKYREIETTFVVYIYIRI